MSSSRYVGRHTSSRRPRLSLGRTGLARNTAKSVAGVGIVLGCGAFVLAPSSAIGVSGTEQQTALGTEPTAAVERLAERTERGETASRSSERSVAVAAPRAKGGDRSAEALDLEVVAKPKPKPKPKPEPKAAPEADSTTSKSADEVEETRDEPAAEPTETAEPTESEETAGAPAEPSPERAEETASRSQERAASPSGGGAVDTGQYASQAAGLGLGPNAQKVYSAVRTQFPDMTDIGGYRAGDGGDHGSGRAVDIMVTGARGDQVAAWLQQNADQLNITYVIWKQRIWMPGGSWEPMEDRGDPTQNHFDHVHVSVS